MRTRGRVSGVLAFLALAPSGYSCEPIVPLYQLLSGSSFAGPALLTHSALWLAIAVLIKSGAFAFLEPRLARTSSALWMFFANIVSTIPGVLIAACASSVSGAFLALPVVFVLGWMVKRRLARLPLPAKWNWISGGAAVLLFVGFYILSVILFALASSARESDSYTSYWLFKFTFVTLVACTGMAISAVLEESVIARLAFKTNGNLSFFHSVLRANYLTLGLVLLVAAVKMLPARWHDPHFLASRWHDLLATITRPIA